VYETAIGSNVVDVDGNRYVDLAAGFGAMLLGHAHPDVLRAVECQSARLLQALGDVFPSDTKIELLERLSALYPEPNARVLLGQSGADAVTAAIKTAALATGRPGVLAFRGAYHGLSYAPLAASTLRESYRAPFSAQLNAHVRVVDYPRDENSAARVLDEADVALRSGEIGAVLIEPVLGRGGVVVPPPEFLPDLARISRARGALFVADEIWTGLGRAGAMLASVEAGAVPDVVCLGKGLGGGLPVSACIGSDAVMHAWRRDAEVVHTSTFAGAPLACAAALATLDVLSREALIARSAMLGERWIERLRGVLKKVRSVSDVRGRGLMIGIDFGARSGAASRAQQALLERGYVVSTGGGSRETLVLTPALSISDEQAFAFCDALAGALSDFDA
jgi:4-aminobutyrate aminotransferase/(S)-3-amino-2-methylpropionate transaminase